MDEDLKKYIEYKSGGMSEFELLVLFGSKVDEWKQNLDVKRQIKELEKQGIIDRFQRAKTINDRFDLLNDASYERALDIIANAHPRDAVALITKIFDPHLSYRKRKMENKADIEASKETSTKPSLVIKGIDGLG